MNKEDKYKTKTDSSAENTRKNKKEYHKPRVIEYGKLKDLTLGGSPGLADSGNPGVFQPPT